MFAYNLSEFNGHHLDFVAPIHAIVLDGRKISIDMENGQYKDCGKVVDWDMRPEGLVIKTTSDYFKISVLSHFHDWTDHLRDLEKRINDAYHFSSDPWWDKADRGWWETIHISDYERDSDEEKSYNLPDSGSEAPRLSDEQVSELAETEKDLYW